MNYAVYKSYVSTSWHRMNVYSIISMTYIQLIQPLSKQSGVAE